MLNAAFWILAATVAAGLGLACFYLLERPIAGAAQAASRAHGLAGAAGVVLLGAAVWTAADQGGFGRTAAALCGIALLAGAAIWVLQRRSRPPGLLIALHATLGVAGFVILAAYFSMSG